jgi:hypothetical protein
MFAARFFQCLVFELSEHGKKSLGDKYVRRADALNDSVTKLRQTLSEEQKEDNAVICSVRIFRIYGPDEFQGHQTRRQILGRPERDSANDRHRDPLFPGLEEDSQ